MVIQKATMEETKWILNHSLTVMEEATAGHVHPNPFLVEQLMLPILREGGYYLVFKEDENIQGWTGIGRQFDPYKQAFAGVIIELYVLPAYRGRKIAEKLCLSALQRLKQSGFRHVQLNVFAGNGGAKHLYEKLGFTDISVLMEKEL